MRISVGKSILLQTIILRASLFSLKIRWSLQKWNEELSVKSPQLCLSQHHEAVFLLPNFISARRIRTGMHLVPGASRSGLWSMMSRLRLREDVPSEWFCLLMMQSYLTQLHCPQGWFPASLLGFLFDLTSFLLFRLDEHQSMHGAYGLCVVVVGAHLDCFDWRLKEEGI